MARGDDAATPVAAPSQPGGGHRLYPHPEDRPLSGRPAPEKPFHPRLYACEFLATAILLACGVASNVAIGSPLSPVGKALAPYPSVLTAVLGFLFGFSSTIAAFSPFGRVSGAHLSPSISLAFMLGSRFAVIDTVCFMLVQLAGAVTGCGLVAVSGWIWPSWGAWCHAAFFAATYPDALAPGWWAAVGEMGTTAILVGLVLFCGAKPRLRAFTPWVAGPLFFVLNPFEAWLSGDSTNLARSFGPAVFAHTWDGFWVYLTGPFAGVALVVILIRIEVFGTLHLHEARRAYFGHDGRAPYLFRWASRRKGA
ncbi:major facilitator superfamily glycerol uptake transporter [Ameyamaea chiangmaiensis NBRC 103196]|uniref:Aquaporin n=2 Tax=Ameyamaea chiangmaiensis TaxID=442969 RepID=A0A850P8C1_9PROT|nr:aquaporin [Ameyamaea chiangmaiensis]NVN40158.1 aquaporin [Ameyamaea chiangmaiensis]GBQ70795.1 major facilitator superfamily glycerol uptake transporter [Ameyamaea chiangmaiensis NBRC 103196]